MLSTHYIPLYEKMRENQLVPEDLHAAISTFPPKFRPYQRHQDYIIYTHLLSTSVFLGGGSYPSLLSKAWR